MNSSGESDTPNRACPPRGAPMSRKRIRTLRRGGEEQSAAVAVASGNLPIKHGDFPWFFLCLPEGIASGNDCYHWKVI